MTGALGITPSFYTYQYTTPASLKGVYTFGPKTDSKMCWTATKIGASLLAKCAYSSTTRNFAANQQFKYELECKGAFGPRIVSVAQPKLCVGAELLASMGQKVTIQSCNGMTNQAWEIQTGPSFDTAATCYHAGNGGDDVFFMTNVNASKCLLLHFVFSAMLCWTNFVYIHIHI